MKYLIPILLLLISCNTNTYKEYKIKTYKIDSSEYVPLQSKSIIQLPYWKLYFHDSINGKLENIWIISQNNDSLVSKYIIIDTINNYRGRYYIIEK